MPETFKIWIDRLRGGRTQKIEETLDPSFLGPNEPELCFVSKVEVKGEAYLTDAHLIISLKARTKVAMPCAICNQMIETDLKVDSFYHTEPIEKISGAQFHYAEPLREVLLTELPKTVECKGGNCPERVAMKPYLRSASRQEKTTYFPFAGMDDLKE